MGEIDYTKYSEGELIEMFGRMDPRWAPVESARLKKVLIGLGYDVIDGGIGPGRAVPSAEKMNALIGSPRALRYPVKYLGAGGLLSGFGLWQNAFNLAGTGTLEADGLYLRLDGRIGGSLALFSSSLNRQQVELEWRNIVDVDSVERTLRVGYRVDESDYKSLTLLLPDQEAVERLVAVLPKERTSTVRPDLLSSKEEAASVNGVNWRRYPITIALLVINTFVFWDMIYLRTESIQPVGSLLIMWGSNFGPYTTEGEWWRLVTSLFLHFGAIHLTINMLALATFGSRSERVYGSLNFILIYLGAGIFGALMSLCWNTDVNSAGASGSIFGLLGALLAVQFRRTDPITGSVLRHMSSSVLAYTASMLVSGFYAAGIDNAAHLGGVSAGFLIGFALPTPLDEASSATPGKFTRYIFAAVLTIALIASGIAGAYERAIHQTGEALFIRTTFWLKKREHIVNTRFNEALHLAKLDNEKLRALADLLDTYVVPFWREASTRTLAVHLVPNSPNQQALSELQHLTEGRSEAYSLLMHGIRNDNQEEINDANMELSKLDRKKLAD